MIQLRPSFWRSLISSSVFFWYSAIFAFGCYVYFNNPEFAESVRGDFIIVVFLLSIPILIYYFFRTINNFSLVLKNDGKYLTFASLLKRFSIPISDIEKVTIASPDLIATSLSASAPSALPVDGRVRVFVGAKHVLHITTKKDRSSIALEIGPGWKQEDLQKFIQRLGKR